MDPTTITISGHAVKRFRERFGERFGVTSNQQAVGMLVTAIRVSKTMHRNKARRYERRGEARPRVACIPYGHGPGIDIVLLFANGVLITVYKGNE